MDRTVDRMKSSILRSLDADEKGQSLKNLRKAALASLEADGSSDSAVDKKELKAQFESCLSSLVEKGKIIEEDGVYSKAAKVKSDKKRKAETNNDEIVPSNKKSNKVKDEDTDDVLKIKAVKDSAAAAEAYSSYSAASAKSKMDLSKFGEQAWKDGETIIVLEFLLLACI